MKHKVDSRVVNHQAQAVLVNVQISYVMSSICKSAPDSANQHPPTRDSPKLYLHLCCFPWRFSNPN